MARRVRRDLSNKRIRQIIKKGLKTGNQPSGIYSKKKVLDYYKPVIYLAGAAFLIFLVYYFLNSISFTDLVSSGQAIPAATERTKQPQNEPEKAEEKTVATDDSMTSPTPVVNPVVHKTQVDVLNGCGVDGIAMKTTKFLRQHDLDVVSMGNYENFDIRISMVINWTGKTDTAKQIAEIMGIDPKQIETRINPGKQLEASIILGSDYKKLKPFTK